MQHLRILGVLVVLLVGVALLTACGGSTTTENDNTGSSTSSSSSGGGTTAADLGVAAYTALEEIIASSNLDTCTGRAEPAELTCNCPGGGTFAWTWPEEVLTGAMTDCKNAAGKNFNGTFVVTEPIWVASFTDAGDCTNAASTNYNPNACTGTYTLTCSGTAVTCTIGGGGGDQNICTATCE